MAPEKVQVLLALYVKSSQKRDVVYRYSFDYRKKALNGMISNTIHFLHQIFRAEVSESEVRLRYHKYPLENAFAASFDLVFF